MWLAFAYYSTCYFMLLQCTVHVCGWQLLTILLVILFWLQCTVHVRSWCVLGLITVMLITPDVFVGGFPAVPPKRIKTQPKKLKKIVVALFAQAKILTFLLACSVSICTVVDIIRLLKAGTVCRINS
jgi:hypothetical protein